MSAVDGTPEDAERRFVIANEFAAVAIAKVRTRNGERLEIRSLSHDQSIRLDALALEALTWSDALEVGHGLKTPMGPEPADNLAVDPPREVDGDREERG